MPTLPTQVVQEATDVGMVAIGGLCVLFYLLLGFASILNERSEMRRQARLYGAPANEEELEETEEEE